MRVIFANGPISATFVFIFCFLEYSFLAEGKTITSVVLSSTLEGRQSAPKEESFWNAGFELRVSRIINIFARHGRYQGTLFIHYFFLVCFGRNKETFLFSLCSVLSLGRILLRAQFPGLVDRKWRVGNSRAAIYVNMVQFHFGSQNRVVKPPLCIKNTSRG